MMLRQILNERSTLLLQVDFLDENEQPVIPSSAVYRIHDLSSGRVICEDTVISPATSVEIHITKDQNRVLSDNQQETRVVTVEFDYGDDGKHGTDEFLYRLKNLSGIRTLPSRSPSASQSPSASASPSASESLSVSPSASPSPSP
jgi:hypothetical protein